MARSDLLINLVKAGANGDRGTFQKTVEAIVAEERAKQHNVVADRIERAAASYNANGFAATMRPATEASHKVRDLVAEIVPRRRLDELFLPELTQLGAQQLIEEQMRAGLLRSHSLEPRHRVLLVGPPGNGKTTLAEALAESLAVPLFLVRYESVIGSFLGETAGRLRRIFDYVKTIPCVLFFDEFDTVGKERGDTHETGEIKRVVSSLLMQVDDLPSYVVVAAATNHAELLDRAVWRRFQVRLSLPAPTQKQLSEFIKEVSRKADLNLGVTPQRAAKALGRISFSEAEEFVLDLARRQILSQGDRPAAEIAIEQMKLWAARGKTACVSSEERNDAGTSAS
jgi:SpoVK/Ycf46/Vps4 family AAA+-type ATPase